MFYTKDACILPSATAAALAQRFQQSWAEWEISTGVALTARHADHHAPAMDIAHL
jgi:hypothetical protein